MNNKNRTNNITVRDTIASSKINYTKWCDYRTPEVFIQLGICVCNCCGYLCSIDEHTCKQCNADVMIIHDGANPSKKEPIKINTMQNEKFDQWCIIEMMGHSKIAGRVTEFAFGGTSFIKVDVPDADGNVRFSRLLNHHAVYAINPVDRETVIEAAQHLNGNVITSYEVTSMADLKAREKLNELINSTSDSAKQELLAAMNKNARSAFPEQANDDDDLF